MLYSYKCSKCGFVFDEFSNMEQRNDTRKCPECLGPAGRNKQAEVRPMDAEYQRWSWAMGATPQAAKEMLKKYPDLVYEHGTEGGRLLVKNRQEKLRLMKIHGMEEYQETDND